VGRRVRVQAYLDDMPDEFVTADLMLCRSGASTVAELAAAGKASVLVPFAAASDDHQRKNADAFVAAGAARMVTEAELTPERLLAVLAELLSNRDKLLQMGERARTLAHRNAVEDIAAMVVALAAARR
jgi:UDP-N-acetylglucosamine--N-acetylmuramyl-(pentapeptide) pyrophosphoryl-undecaprenol N-acetylglucosamine transferase